MVVDGSVFYPNVPLLRSTAKFAENAKSSTDSANFAVQNWPELESQSRTAKAATPLPNHQGVAPWGSGPKPAEGTIVKIGFDIVGH